MSNDILELIGNTPIVKLNRINSGKCSLWLKMESMNPGGSVKDRIGLSMIRDAESRGKIKPGDTLVEATAGNTGLGLALVANLKGYRLILVVPDKMSQEKISHLRAMGAEIIMTRSDVAKGHPEYYQDLALRISRETGGYYINQFENPANPLAHETTTGPELWEQMEHDIDAVVVGVGSSGTVTGLTHFFKKVSSNVEMILADPEGSVLAEYVNTGKITNDAGSWLVEGIGEDFIPSICDFSMTKKAYTISDKESFDAVRSLLLNEGIMAGSSSGTLIAAALKYCREQESPKRVVTFVCDSGNKYLSKMYNDHWLLDHGLIRRKKFNDLRDIISHRFEDNSVIHVRPDDTLMNVYSKMKLYDISQVPVLLHNKIIGIIDEHNFLTIMFSEKNILGQSVENFMSTDLKKLSPSGELNEVFDILSNGQTPVIEDRDGNFHGIITKIDLINYLKNERR